MLLCLTKLIFKYLNSIEHINSIPSKKNQGAKPKRKGLTLAALPGRNFNPMVGLDSPEKKISGSIDEEDVQVDVGSFNNDNDNDDIDSLEEHIFCATSAIDIKLQFVKTKYSHQHSIKFF